MKQRTSVGHVWKAPWALHILGFKNIFVPLSLFVGGDQNCDYYNTQGIPSGGMNSVRYTYLISAL